MGDNHTNECRCGFGFLNGDLNLTLDYFNKDTKDLLWRRALPASIGGTNMTVWDNVGKMNNKGLRWR